MNNNDDFKRPVPEYVRRGVKPVGSGGKSLLHDSAGMPKGPPAKKRQIPPPPEPLSHRPVLIKASTPSGQIRAANFVRGVNAPSAAKEVPAQTRVSVGVHDDQMWTESLGPTHPMSPNKLADFPNRKVVTRPDGSRQVVIDNDEYVDIDRLQGLDNLDPNLQVFRDEDVPVPPEVGPGIGDDDDVGDREEMSDSEPPDHEYSEGLEPGEYGVYFGGECVYRTRDISELKAGVEEMAIKYKVSLADVHVLKRVNLKFGLIME